MIRTKTLFLISLTSILHLCILSGTFAQQVNPFHRIGTANGVYYYSPGQTPAPLTEIYSAVISASVLSYQWYSCTSPNGVFTAIANATASSYSPPALTNNSVTTYYVRQTITSAGLIISNAIKIAVVSANWEDINYIREHDVLITGQSNWAAVDQLSIGSKLQTTTYLDGLGRSIEKVSKQTATPAAGSNAWGDMVQFSQYDALNREPIKYLPYTTTTQSGNFKTTQLTEQPAYYANTATYNETSAFSTITFDNSPLNRVINVKEPGAAWAASSGNSANYDVNSATENVQVWDVDYTQGDAPVNNGAYSDNTLYKLTYTDVNGKQVIEYTNMSGQLILKKVQIDNAPSIAHSGWICTYSVYDDFGLLRFQIQPEGVKYLDANNWSFASSDGQTVLAEQVFQYNYDDKGRTIWKKAPGASPLNMVYDIRDRVVFMQDGNQSALSTPQWTANLYDVLDRPVITALYNTNETVSSLQTDINNAAATSSVTITNSGAATVSESNLSLNPISSTNLNSASTCSVLKYLFYDDYSFSAKKSFDNNYTNLIAYSTSDANVIPIATSARTLSMPTGSMTKILNTNVFLTATNYFDEKGRHIQTLEDNIKTGVDITTQQYHFDGRLLSSCNSHTSNGTGYATFITLSKYIFDNIGRVTSIQKQYGTNVLKTVAAYDYDDMGRVKTKHLDPNYNNPNSGLPDLESLNYSFNIHNQITGINKDYALKNPANYSKWGHFFGLYLGYDNKDNFFVNARLNGQVTGQAWNSQGDDEQRKYDYEYDNADRLAKANFLQNTNGAGWEANTLNFSIHGFDADNLWQLKYDYNGNIQGMVIAGFKYGTPNASINALRYNYLAHSNKLNYVNDDVSDPNTTLGNFHDGTNAAGTPDYVYDANGNVVVDLNKNAQSLNNGAAGTNGIHYNFLDKPDQIRIVGKGTINIVYSADGEKLQRVFIPETSGATSTITTYINQFVFQETSTTITTSSAAPFSGTGTHLAYINFEEGRIRAMTNYSNATVVNGVTLDAISENGNIILPAAPAGGFASGAFDYFIMDYQQNVRMILTEETHAAMNTCTMETTRASAEDPVFGQTGGANEVEVTRYPTPTGWTNNSSNSVSQLGKLCGHYIGPNSLQKVMAGDVVSATVQYYFQNTVSNSYPNIVPTLLSSLSQAIGGSATTGIVHNNATAITNQLNGTPAFTNEAQPTGVASAPQAYLTILFFDERFNLVSAANGGLYQQQVATSWTTNTPALAGTIQAPKNGYVYVYVSNRSDQDVYFDNFAVTVAAGNIIEENHYYAFGLKIAGISSHKLPDANEGRIKNNYLYNDKELFEDADLDWYDYGFRNYDPQIARFMQLDPLTWDYPHYTPYQFAGNDPITNVDLDGLEESNIVKVGATVTTALNDGEKIAQDGGIISSTVVVTQTIHKIVKVANATTIILNFTKNLVNVLDKATTAPAGKVSLPSKMTDNARVVHPTYSADKTEPEKETSNWWEIFDRYGLIEFGDGGNGSESTASKAKPGTKILESINTGGDNSFIFPLLGSYGSMEETAKAGIDVDKVAEVMKAKEDQKSDNQNISNSNRPPYLYGTPPNTPKAQDGSDSSVKTFPEAKKLWDRYYKKFHDKPTLEYKINKTGDTLIRAVGH